MRITAVKVEKPVRLMDRAVLPLAIDDKKFEIFPPGQDATRIIPNARLGWGFTRRISKKGKKGNSINWDKIPINGDLELRNNNSKCSVFKSRATPNIMSPRIIFRNNKLPWLKFSDILSILECIPVKKRYNDKSPTRKSKY